MTRRHSVFGDYVIGNEPENVHKEIADYNTLWKKYTSACGWGSIPTEKGFEKWLQEQLRRKDNGK